MRRFYIAGRGSSYMPDLRTLADVEILAGGSLAPPEWSRGAAGDLRKRVMRPHWEAPVREATEISQRMECDQWLDRLLRLELLVSMGQVTVAEAGKHLGTDARNTLVDEAVQRYIDDYDYFGVRFLLARIQETRGFLPPLIPPFTVAAESAVSERFLQKNDELSKDETVQAALFLMDDFVFASTEDAAVEHHKEGLRKWLATPAASRAVSAGFTGVAAGAARLIREKAAAYREVESHPIRTRFAIFDFYWLSKFFDRSISTTGKVTAPLEDGQSTDWMALLGIASADAEVLRCAWVLASHWIQGTSMEQEPETASLPATYRRQPWPSVYHQELVEIRKQRAERDYSPMAEQATTEAVRESLTGLAFSGGGIRSATFNLGVLEALRELDLLRRFDYLSTVSGGGYIGSWLTSNAKRRPYWLRREADWRGSIQHLRRYSNYLSPQVGFLSADTWTMFSIWSRNTILIQTLVVFAIALLLLIPYMGKPMFDLIAANADGGWGAKAQLAGYALLAAASTVSAYNLWKERLNPDEGRTFGQLLTQATVVLPYLAAAHIAAAAIWGQVHNGSLSAYTTYGEFLGAAAVKYPGEGPWLRGLLFSLLCVSALSLGSIGRRTWRRVLTGILSPIGTMVVLYFGLCALAWLFAHWRTLPYGEGAWRAFVFGPSLVLMVFNISVVFLIGLLGRCASDGQREWWSRLGAWFCIYGAGTVAMPVFSIYAAYPIYEHSWVTDVKWPAIGAWLATTAGGLLAGRSGTTKGEAKETGSGKKIVLEVLAAVGPVVFIVGLVAAVSVALFSILDLFRPEGPAGMKYWELLQAIPWQPVAAAAVICMAMTALLCFRLDVNVFSLNTFYRYRLTRCYLGASRDGRREGRFTGFDPNDDLTMASLSFDHVSEKEPRRYVGPMPIVNCALNLGGSSDLELHTRHSAAFAFTPLHAGADRAEVGYVPLQAAEQHYCGKEYTPSLGHVVSVSGAAANPNMGFHTSPTVAFLMTVFNVRLGGWFPNPSRNPVTSPGPRFSGAALMRELFGIATASGRFVNLSDGGHFENLGIYELVRRKCQVIVAGDAECDSEMSFGSLGNVIRLCETDFGAKITIDVSSIRRGEDGYSRAHCAVGTILYNDGSEGFLIYLKSSLTGDEETAVREYKDSHPTFPHESTGDQFFTDQQFESYRMLGYAICRRAFRDCTPVARRSGERVDPTLREYARQMLQIWTPNLASRDKFSALGDALQGIWAQLRSHVEFQPLLTEFLQPAAAGKAVTATPAVYCLCQEILQLMENVYLELMLDDTWNHPDNSGWRELFVQFARSPQFRDVWSRSKSTYGRRFQNFCEQRLGLPSQEISRLGLGKAGGV